MKIAVVGATGLVGREVVKILIDKKLVRAEELTLFASKSSSGKILSYGDVELCVNELSKKNIKKYDYAIFCAGNKVSKEFSKSFIDRGAIVIDNSSAFRREKNVPLVVPQINMNTVGSAKLIANPNCSTIGAGLPLFCLSKTYKIKRVIVSTYQAVSGSGQNGVSDLQQNTKKKFAHEICNNLIPQIDVSLSNGYTYEEDKMSFELKKILSNRFLKISATCVRVPIVNCHSESVNIQFASQPNLKQVINCLNKQKGIVIANNIVGNSYPMPIFANGKNEVVVGRIRSDTSCKKAINLFLSFDNIRKGASLNAVQIMEELIKQNNNKAL